MQPERQSEGVHAEAWSKLEPQYQLPWSMGAYGSLPADASVNQAVALLIAPEASEASISRWLTRLFTAAVTAAT
jgi:hypothetical protein